MTCGESIVFCDMDIDVWAARIEVGEVMVLVVGAVLMKLVVLVEGAGLQTSWDSFVSHDGGWFSIYAHSDIEERHKTIQTFLTSSPQRRPRIDILTQPTIYINMNPRIHSTVKAYGGQTPRDLGAPTLCHIEVDKLGICLSVVGVPPRMQCEDLVSQHVHASLKVTWNVEIPLEVVVDKIVHHPGLEPVSA